MSALPFVMEYFTHVLSRRDETQFGFFNPYGNPFVLDPKAPPTHYTTEGGGTYSARPDLTRAGGPGIYRAAAGVAVLAATMAGTDVIIQSYEEVIKDESPEEQRSAWRVLTSALTGTFGIGSAGQQFV